MAQCEGIAASALLGRQAGAEQAIEEPLVRWLLEGSLNWYGVHLAEKMLDLTVMSINIEEWLRSEMRCHRFLNLLHDHFAGARFTLVSSTGPGYDLNTDDRPNPLRVLDPFFSALTFMLEAQQTIHTPFWRRVAGKITSLKERNRG